MNWIYVGEGREYVKMMFLTFATEWLEVGSTCSDGESQKRTGWKGKIVSLLLVMLSMKMFEITKIFHKSIQMYGTKLREDIQAKIRTCVTCILVMPEAMDVDGLSEKRLQKIETEF